MGNTVITPEDRAVGARLRAARRRAGITQQELAAWLGVTYQQVHKYEHGINRITAPRVLAAAHALGCAPGALLWSPEEDPYAPLIAAARAFTEACGSPGPRWMSATVRRTQTALAALGMTT